MAYRLIDRNRQIPNGMFFVEPRTKWKSTAWSSFNSIVDQVISHRTANAWLGLATDRPTVETQVDQFISEVCARMGWGDYITTAEGGAVPATPFQDPAPLNLSERLTNVAGGAEVLVEWIKSGAGAVAPELSTARALKCATLNDGKKCPLNGTGGLERFFTVPVSNAIRAAYAQRRAWKLETPYDNQIGVCEACSCPLGLKVHIPLEQIRAKLSAEQKGRLHPQCWILNES